MWAKADTFDKASLDLWGVPSAFVATKNLHDPFFRSLMSDYKASKPLDMNQQE